MNKKHIKVLLIEDNQGDVRLIWEILSEVRNSPFYLEVAATLLGGLQSLEKAKPDIVLLDLTLPDSNGIYTLNRVKDKVKEIPVVVLTGMDDEMLAIKSLKEGAQDYLVKGRTDSELLKRAILHAIERNKLISDMEENDRKLKESYERLKIHDDLRESEIKRLSEDLALVENALKDVLKKLESGGSDQAEIEKAVRETAAQLEKINVRIS
ncbi:MAG: Response regulator PleD [Candidatus Aerophobetes bacterium ADurb.Bin490]|nr:MAG: Response regulator PleD [Candidatus Aerophobetes bacterium ADurb.Bin490]HNZ29261.1 response regulator [Candidatus Goldiibacteriota bacterium]HPI02698.1 response regulator [Candidatus Goldiibacteriota bacterium]HRQ43677.1 response regulator [Candidatus Goldiibacteriota bacterium]